MRIIAAPVGGEEMGSGIKDTAEARKGMAHPDSAAGRRECPLSSYTYEDYLKDFELDYLGFDGIPDGPDSGSEEKHKSYAGETGHAG